MAFVSTGLQPTTLPGGEDPNEPAIATVARVQGYSSSADTWRNICFYNPDDPPLNPCGLSVALVNANPIPVEVVTGGGAAIALTTSVGVGDVGLAVRTASEDDIAQGTLYLESIDQKTPPQGQDIMARSTPVVLASDHTLLGAELHVGGSPLANTNPVPVRGIVPSRTPTGSAVAASSGQIGTDGVGALLYMQMNYVAGGANHYILLFDAASAATLSNTNLIPGLVFPIGPTLQETQQRFAYPLSFASGLRWAISSTKHTYTAAANTAIVFAQWVML